MRDNTGSTSHDCPAPLPELPLDNLVGLALSGGGIRSASFNLGFLQGLAFREKLPEFDYLSTVFGGGFIGGRWSAWLSRREREAGIIFPEPEELELDRRFATVVLIGSANGAAPAEAVPLSDGRWSLR